MHFGDFHIFKFWRKDRTGFIATDTQNNRRYLVTFSRSKGGRIIDSSRITITELTDQPLIEEHRIDEKDLLNAFKDRDCLEGLMRQAEHRLIAQLGQ